MGQGAPVPPPPQPPGNFTLDKRIQRPSALAETPLSQQSAKIPPGQPSASQHALDSSQPSPTPAQYLGASWQPPGAQVVFPRSRVVGLGMAGMMPNVPQFPPPFPPWGQQVYASPRPTPMMPSQATIGHSCPKTPSTGGKTITGRNPNIRLSPHWRADEEYYDNQRLHGPPLPRVIRSSSSGQFKDIEGCDLLTLPLCKILYQGSENFWLRKLANGRDVYVVTMGEISQVVFVSEIFAQIRTRGIDLDRLAQHKALQDGLTSDKKEAIPHMTKLLVDQMQKWLPATQADSGAQHQIAALQVEIAELKAKAGSAAPPPEAPAPAGSSQPSSQGAPSPIEGGNQSAAFDPAQLLVTPGSINPWLQTNMPESFSDTKYKAWFKGLKLDIVSRQTIERDFVAMDHWWQNQPDEAESTIHRVAVCHGIPPGKIKSGHNENLLKVLTVALTLTS